MKKSKNAFTLIELLAVIVILAVIALIATPIILGIVEDAKKDAFLRSVELLVSTTDIDIANKTFEEEYTYTITDGNVSNMDVSIKNTTGMNGTITYDLDGKEVYAIHNGVYCVKKTSGMDKAEITDYDGTCSYSNVTDASCFTYEYLNYDIEINETKCIEYYENQGFTNEYAVKYCNNESFTFLEYINLLDEETRADNYVYELLSENNLLTLNSNNQYEISDVTACNEYLDEEGYEIEVYCGNDVYREPLLDKLHPYTKDYYKEDEQDYDFSNLLSEGVIVKKFNMDTYITLLGYNVNASCSSDIIIPDTIDGYPVKTISSTYFNTYYGTGWFSNKEITSIVFPEGITSIEAYTFVANKIESIVFPKSLEYIGTGAFWDNQLSGELDLSHLSKLTQIEYRTFNENPLTSVKFPSNITYIGSTFGNDTLTSVTFYGRSDLTGVTIGDYAWSWASGYNADNNIYFVNE